MNFITKLPKSRDPNNKVEYNGIIVIIDKTTKYKYFIPHKEANKAEHVAFRFLSTVVAQHGIPNKIITDKDVRFTSRL